MARTRSIKPGFFTNEELGSLPPLARLLFAGLWCHADREGRLEDRPKRLKANILPYDDIDPDDALQSLADKGFIFRYEANGARYIQVLAFKKHQNPHVHEQASTVPAPCMNGTGTSNSGTSPAFLFLPSTLLPIPLPPDPPEPGVWEELAERLYRRHPKKQGKVLAEQALVQAVVEAQLGPGAAAMIEERHAAWCDSKDWQRSGGQFAPTLASWIQRQGWKDDPPTAKEDVW